MRARSARADRVQVTPASGTRMAARKTLIFIARPIRKRPFLGAGLIGGRSARRSVGAFVCVLMVSPSGSSRFERAAPVGDGYPPAAVHAGEVDALETLVALRREVQRRADSQVEVPDRLERLAEAGTGQVAPGPLQRLRQDPGVHVAFQVKEAVAVCRVRCVPARLR